MIPDYQTLMLPVLRVGAAGETGVRECIERLAKECRLTDEERTQLLRSGKQTIFANRVHWAITYMVKAALLQRTRRAHFIATERGKSVLSQSPQRIDNKTLYQVQEFRDFKATTVPAEDDKPAEAPAVETATPEERLEAASTEIDESLRTELLERVVQGTPAFFEKLVIDLLLAMKYGAGAESGKHLGRTGDGGIDGIITGDALGLDTVYIQAKRYSPGNGVGIEKIHEFAGAMAARGAIKGVFVTTSHFTEPARRAVERVPQRMILIDGDKLSRLLVRYGVGARIIRTIEMKKLDLDYFETEEA
jgi:restriction system protein